ncbi:VOC family protein [Glycomyces xiaoerkulensis]|uniref:VOC family protein n=1 Tax=Glycomyces xiaoerkulensis TaxID=2038139 RepID=UPI000C267018|nr:VOC family protein [Glycomyces xiaoerkulensis]
MSQSTTRLGARQIDLADWRWVLGALRARFDTGSFAAGAEFVAAAGRICDAAGPHPEVDLRARHIRLALRSDDLGGVTEREVRLAERLSALASEQGLDPRPDRLQELELALDTPASEAVRPFWAAVLGGGEAGGEILDPAGRLPPLWFQATDSTAPDRQRFHLDVTVPPEVADRRIAAAVAAGGRVVDESRAPAFVVVADPDGNKACICTELGRE